MTYYRSCGVVPRKKHTQLRQPSGELYHEELFGQQGFDGPSSLLYHVAPPTEVVAIEPVASETTPTPPLERVLTEHRHHRLRSEHLDRPGDFATSRTPLFANDDLTVSVATPDCSSDGFSRNAFADEMVFVHSGEGTVGSPFGLIDIEDGDIVVIPRGTTIEWRLAAGTRQRLLVMESRTDIAPPSRHLASSGQYLEASPISERDLKVPRFAGPVESDGPVHVRVVTGSTVTLYTMNRHPFDVAGWDGCLYPYAFNVRDFEPLTKRTHLMPNMHQILATTGAAVCLLVPRKVDYHPEAIPAAMNHASIDCDEVLYVVTGGLSARPDDGPGTITFHPRGVMHGPKPGMYERSIGMTESTAMAVMIDTFRPLHITAAAMAVDDAAYPFEWVPR